MKSYLPYHLVLAYVSHFVRVGIIHHDTCNASSAKGQISFWQQHLHLELLCLCCPYKHVSKKIHSVGVSLAVSSEFIEPGIYCNGISILKFLHLKLFLQLN